MKALSTFFDRLFFAVVCVVAWVIFPVLIAVGAALLLVYAVIAEACSSKVVEPAPIARDDDARRIASRLCRTLPQ